MNIRERRKEKVSSDVGKFYLLLFVRLWENSQGFLDGWRRAYSSHFSCAHNLLHFGSSSDAVSYILHLF